MADTRQWIDPALDGAGGGYGKFKGLSCRDLAEMFDKLTDAPNMRSVSAILRITREQLEARQALGVSRQAAVVLGVTTLLLVIATLLMQGRVRLGFAKALLISSVLFFGFFAGAWSSRKQARSARAQERAIQEIAMDALERITSQAVFKRKPLDAVQKGTLRRLMRSLRRSYPGAAILLQDP